jgi:tRNA(Arg) A34 adenosine deaminase TadA
VEKADLWQKVLNSINSGEMPPEDEKQPDPAAKTDFLDDLSRMLVTARAVLSDSGGKIAMRRLNRREYKNTIRDLLGVDINVRRGEIVGRGSNRVTSTNDPTAHAEVVAIRDACTALQTFQLTDCELYTSCEPCPMCLSAIYWARIPQVYYGNTRADAAAIGFDDEFIYQQVPLAPEARTVKLELFLRDEAQIAFQEWANKTDKIRY